jgi:hypothetical protein
MNLTFGNDLTVVACDALLDESATSLDNSKKSFDVFTLSRPYLPSDTFKNNSFNM